MNTRADHRFLISESIVRLWVACSIEKDNGLIKVITDNHGTTLIEEDDAAHFSNVRRVNPIQHGQISAVDHNDRIRRKTNEVSIVIETDSHRVRSADSGFTDEWEISRIKSTKCRDRSTHGRHVPIVVQN